VLDSPRWLRVAAFGGAVIVAFDIVASLTSRATGIPYARFAYGSYFIQAATGFMGRRAGLPLGKAALLGTWVGGVEATLGWAVSWWLGPGRPASPLTISTIIGVAVFVAIVATLLAALGAWLSQLGRPRVQREA
jgi:hypothetical protein